VHIAGILLLPDAAEKTVDKTSNLQDTCLVQHEGEVIKITTINTGADSSTCAPWATSQLYLK